MKRVILESPYFGNVEANTMYARRCVADCLKRGEAPLASHLLYTQSGILNDENSYERALGIEAGHSWIRVADYMVVYEDLGTSQGMEDGISRAKRCMLPIEYRTIGK